MFMIRNKEGLTSTGGMNPQFKKKGKVWTGMGPLRNHLNLVHGHHYVDCDIVEYEMVAIDTIPVSVELAGSRKRAADRDAERKAARDNYQKEARRREYLRLKREFGE